MNHIVESISLHRSAAPPPASSTAPVAGVTHHENATEATATTHEAAPTQALDTTEAVTTQRDIL